MKLRKIKSSLAVCLLSLYSAQFAQSAIVDVFIATGQSNAFWGDNPDNSGYLFGHGVQDALVASGQFSNPAVVIQGEPGRSISGWYDGLGGPAGPRWIYDKQFFDSTPLDAPGVGALEAQIDAIITAGDTPRFRGLFWFQGESDMGDGEFLYTARWDGLLATLDSDLTAAGVSNTDYNFVMNTIGDLGPLDSTNMNGILADITDADPRGVLFDTQVAPYRTDFSDVHGYDHYAVGQANAQLFINSFAAVNIDPAFSGSFTEVSDTTDQAYSGDQSGSDLIEGLTAAAVSGWNFQNGADPAELNDGIHGAFPGGDAEGAWTTVGAFAEYNLGPNALGYDITGIQSIASWEGAGFGNQVWSVEVKPVGGSYAPLASVDYTPFSDTEGGATKVNLTGLDATGIESIKFTAGSTGGNSFGNDFVWREIDVFGIATVPEPSATALLGLGGLALILRRRRG